MKKEELNRVVGQRIVEVRQSPLQTPAGRYITVDAVVLADGTELRTHAHETEDGPQGDLLITAKPDRLPDLQQREALAAGLGPAVAVRMVDRLFAGRKGHGGGPCMSRVLRRADLQVILEAVYDAGQDAGRCMHPKEPAAAPEVLSDPIVWEGYEGFNPEFTGYTAAPYSTGQPERGWCLFTHNGCWQQRTKPILPPVPGATPVRRKGSWRWLLPASA